MLTRRNLLIGSSAAIPAGGGGYWMLRGPDYEDLASADWKPMSPQAGSDVDYLVHYATRAANGHNTQPWLFKASDKGMIILPDTARATPVVDPDDHHMFASLGCAAENMILAANAEGKSAAVRFVDEGEGSINLDLAPGGTSNPAWFNAILARQCTRSEYDGRAVSAEDLQKLETAAKIDGCRAILINDKPKIEQVLDLIVAANTAQVDDPAFVAELKSWLRFNASSAAKTHDGLYAGCSGNPTLPSWIAPTVFGMVFSGKSENERCIKQVRSSSGIAVFVAEKDDKTHWVQAGRSYQRFALQATAMGMKNAFLNQPTEVPNFRPELLRLVGATEPRPNLLVRFGYGDPMPRSLRRPVKDVLVQT